MSDFGKTMTFEAIRLEAEYFEDMTFEDRALAPIFKVVDRYQAGSRIDICTVEISRLEADDDTFGEYSPKDRAISIAADVSPDGVISYTESNLLHEMIHHYEHEVSEINNALCEYLVIHLWKKLSPAIDDLDKLVMSFIELESHSETERSGGRHGVLFLLKSFDLDRRLGVPLGTVFGYGMADDLAAESGIRDEP